MRSGRPKCPPRASQTTPPVLESKSWEASLSPVTRRHGLLRSTPPNRPRRVRDGIPAMRPTVRVSLERQCCLLLLDGRPHRRRETREFVIQDAHGQSLRSPGRSSAGDHLRAQRQQAADDYTNEAEDRLHGAKLSLAEDDLMAAEGIEVRHVAACRSHGGGTCSCRPSYRASVWSNREGKLIRRASRRWPPPRRGEHDAAARSARGRMRPPRRRRSTRRSTHGGPAQRPGTIRTRGRRPFAPSTIVAVEQNYRLRVADAFGARPARPITLQDLQEFVDELDAAGREPEHDREHRPAAASRVPLRPREGHRARRPHGRPRTAREGTAGARLPPSPQDAAELLAAAPEQDRAVWATAMLAGLRRGELMALRWEDVDLKAGRLRVERSYDPGGARVPAARRAGRAAATCRSLGRSRRTCAST